MSLYNVPQNMKAANRGNISVYRGQAAVEESPLHHSLHGHTALPHLNMLAVLLWKIPYRRAVQLTYPLQMEAKPHFQSEEDQKDK